MKKHTSTNLYALAGALVFTWAETSHAALVSTWTSDHATPNITAMGAGFVTVGDGTPNSADGRRVAGEFSPITLANDGDSIILTATVQTIGGTANDNQFRFGLLDSNGSISPTNQGWLGYNHRAGSPIDGSVWEMNAGNTGGYHQSSAQTQIATSTNTGLIAFDDGTYDLTMTLTRNGTGMDITTTITEQPGGSGYSQSLIGFSDATSNTFTFDRLMFQMGGSLDLDQGVYTNVDVSFQAVPEPSISTMLGLSGLALALRRRRA